MRGYIKWARHIERGMPSSNAELMAKRDENRYPTPPYTFMYRAYQDRKGYTLYHACVPTSIASI